MSLETLTPVSIQEDIFNLLKRRGPLCASQIAVDLGRSLRKIREFLEEMKAEGVVELRPDRDRSMPYDENETPWGLKRPSWLRKAV
jgi:predicted ArsR family transcriptional regulator